MARRIALVSLVLVLVASPSLAYEFGFQYVTAAPIGANCYDVKTADLNGDGRPDVVAALFDSRQIAVVFGTPTGLGTPSYYPSLGSPVAVDLADYDGNGSIDILEADWYQTRVRLLVNQ